MKVSDPRQYCEGSNVYATAVMKCFQRFWCDNYQICPIWDHMIPLEKVHGKGALRKCYDCGAITHQNFKTFKNDIKKLFIIPLTITWIKTIIKCSHCTCID